MTKNNVPKLILIIFSAIFGLALIGAVLIWNFTDLPHLKEVEVISNIKLEKITNINSEPELDKNTVRNQKLQSKTDELLTLFDKNMQSVQVFIRDEPIIKSGTEAQQRVAYTICENKNDPTIFVKNVFYQDANNKQLINILKHELTHAYFCQQGIRAGHDERWRKKFTEVGGFGN